MIRHTVAVLAGLSLVVLVGVVRAPPASAHAALRASEPVAGSALPAPPTAVSLTFSEPPEVSLSAIRVVGPEGASHEVGPPQPAPGDRHVLIVPVGLLGNEVYTVEWKVVSGVDGHPSRGTFVFGVGVTPAVTAARPAAEAGSPTSSLEIAGRWAFAVGIVGLLGAASGRIFGFARDPAVIPRRRSRRAERTSRGAPLDIVSWGVAFAGFLLFGEAQRRGAGVPIGQLASTSVGRALAARAVGLLAAGAGLLLARSRRHRLSRGGTGLVATAAAGTVAVHVEAGHAGAGGGPLLAVALQWAHVVALGVWFGGLAVLLLATRGAPSKEKAEAVRRFSSVAAGALFLVVVTGVVRSFDEVSSWDALTSTGYGRAVVVKSALLLAIAVLGGVNRWHSVPLVSDDLRPLRRTAAAELGAAVAAMAAAGLLASTVPPAAAAPSAVGLEVTGSDAGTSIRLRLSMATAGPGPNRFEARVTDYDSGRAVRASAVTLRFTSLEDVGEPGTTLELSPQGDGSFASSGTNLALDGRWRVTALVELDNDSVSVPLLVDVRGARHFVSVARRPGEPVRYIVDLGQRMALAFSVDPAQAGRNRVALEYADVVAGEVSVEDLVLTTRPPSGPTREHPVSRLGPGRFVAEIALPPGSTRITATARTSSSRARLRGSADVEIAG